MFSCNKPVLNENATLPSNSLGVEFTDTLTLKTYTVREDSLKTDGLAINLLGFVDEPVFGRNAASIYAQFSLPVDNINLGSNLTVDSVVLSLQYAGSYGRFNLPVNLNVYRITDRLYADSAYYSGRTFGTQTTVLGSLTNYAPNITDSVAHTFPHDTSNHAPQMRIRLDNSFGQDILNQSGSSNVTDNDAFLNYFGGLYIAPDTTKPGTGMLYFDLGASESKLSIYYNDTVVNFYIDSRAETVTHFKHNYAGSSVAGVLNSSNPNGDNLVFAQSMAGVKGKVFVPYIKNLGNIAINKAELEMTVVSDNGNYDNPYQLIANGIDSLGANALLPDQLISDSYFGGYKTSETDGGTDVVRYKINLARYYQGLVNGKVDTGVYVFPTPPNREADRVVLGGGTYANPKYRMKLNLTYTKIN